MGVVPTMPSVIVGDGETQQIRAAAPVIGNGQWREMADLANWLTGRGAQLVCGNPQITFHAAEGNGGPTFGGLSPGELRTLRAYAWPRTQFSYRVWLVALGAVEVGHVWGYFRNHGGTQELGTFDFVNPAERVAPIKLYRVVEPFSAASGETGLQIFNDDLADTYLIVYGFCCFELPFSAHPDIPDEQTLNTKSPIFEETDNLESLDMVAMAADALDTHARRAGLFSWYSAQSVTISATTFTGTSNVFQVKPTVMPRHLHNGVTTTAVNWATYANATGGYGYMKLTASSGATTTVTITSSSFTMIPGTLAVRTEDPSRLETDGGIRTGSRDYVTVEVSRVTASSMEIRGFWMGEG